MSNTAKRTQKRIERNKFNLELEICNTFIGSMIATVSMIAGHSMEDALLDYADIKSRKAQFLGDKNSYSPLELFKAVWRYVNPNNDNYGLLGAVVLLTDPDDILTPIVSLSFECEGVRKIIPLSTYGLETGLIHRANEYLAGRSKLGVQIEPLVREVKEIIDENYNTK